MNEREYLTTTEAASRLGVTIGTLQNRCRIGILPAVKTETGEWRIPRRAVEKIIDERWEKRLR